MEGTLLAFIIWTICGVTFIVMGIYAHFSKEPRPMGFWSNCKTEGEYDLVYSASAFHWVPEEIGYPKIYAILKNRGVFAKIKEAINLHGGSITIYDTIDLQLVRKP